MRSRAELLLPWSRRGTARKTPEQELNVSQNACIVGYGVVGKATAETFGIPNYIDLNGSTIGVTEAARSRYVFLCLPTPTVDGKADTRALFESVAKINTFPEGPDGRIFVVRSTVPPGFNRALQQTFGRDNIVSNPEFLTMATAHRDAINPDLIVVGADNPSSAQSVSQLYATRFPDKKQVVTDSTTAELIKYTLNTFFALKVVFGNEVYDFAQRLGADYEMVREVLEQHKWGSKNHFDIWFRGKRGVHGRCLPKDSRAMATETRSPLLESIHVVNDRIKDQRPPTEL